MATAIDFTDRNDFIGKPKEMTDNQVYALPVCRLITHIPGPTAADPSERVPAHVSCWKLTEEEIEEIKRTGVVYLKVIGHGMVPLSIHGKKPIYRGDDGMCDIVISENIIEQLRNQGQINN